MQALKNISGLRVFEVDIMGNLTEVTQTGIVTDKQVLELLNEGFTLGPDTWLFNGYERAAKFSIKQLKNRILGMERTILSMHKLVDDPEFLTKEKRDEILK